MSKFLNGLTGVAYVCLTLCTTPAQAQEAFPAKPIRVIVPFSPGASDTQIRALAPHVSSRIGQQLVIENVPGGGGSIAANRVKRSPADGYTLFFSGMASLTLVPASRADLGYKLEDFTPVANVSTVTGVLVVNANSPYKSLKDFIDQARRNPGRINFGTPGVASAGHTMAVGPQVYGDFLLTHVPFKGGADVVQAVMADTVEMGCALPSLVVPQINGGRLRPLAITAGKRSEFLPDVPTYRELGIDYEDYESYGLLGPAGLPGAIVQKLAAAVAEAVKEPSFLETMRKTYTSVEYVAPAEYRAQLQARDAEWRRHLGNARFVELLK
jgi:tripartite-type tricarboxylate transporter receptor subunit TctC